MFFGCGIFWQHFPVISRTYVGNGFFPQRWDTARALGQKARPTISKANLVSLDLLSRPVEDQIAVALGHRNFA